MAKLMGNTSLTRVTIPAGNVNPLLNITFTIECNIDSPDNPRRYQGLLFRHDERPGNGEGIPIFRGSVPKGTTKSNCIITLAGAGAGEVVAVAIYSDFGVNVTSMMIAVINGVVVT